MSRLSKILIAAAALAALQAGPSLWIGLSTDGGRKVPGWGYPAPAAAQQPPADRLAPRREGDDFAMGPPGTCGKDGQGVPVGDGVPTLRVAKLTIGGTAA